MFGEVGNIIGQALQILSALIFAALALGMTVFSERRKGSENEEI